jgi:hypothetical protein
MAGMMTDLEKIRAQLMGRSSVVVRGPNRAREVELRSFPFLILSRNLHLAYSLDVQPQEQRLPVSSCNSLTLVLARPFRLFLPSSRHDTC